MDKVNPTGSGSFSLNRRASTTIGQYSVAAGNNTTASGVCSHAEGIGTIASGSYSHAEGNGAQATGANSHAEGAGVTASGRYSHAEGDHTIAAGSAQHVSGRYNIADNDNTYAEIVGNGTGSQNRSNARTLDWQGNETITGDLTFNGSISLSDKIDTLGSVSRFTATGSVYGSFSCKAINGIKCITVNNPKGLTANALTTLDFTLPETMRPIDRIHYFDIRQPSDNYTIRLIINPDGAVQIYNYGTATGTLNMSFTGCYI